MKKLIFTLGTLLSLNGFAQENGLCSEKALKSIQSVAAINGGSTLQSNEIKRMTVTYRGASTSGMGVYCSVLKDDEYCVKMAIINGNICQVVNLEVSSFSF